MEKNIKILESAELGRYGVAEKNLLAGEIFFEEFPFAFGPKSDNSPICLECYCAVDGTKSGADYRCNKCGWPMCLDCKKLDKCVAHHMECEIFQKNKVKFQNVEDTTAPCLQLDCITPLRVLLQKDLHFERWEKELACMEHHEVIRRDSLSWKSDDHNIVKYLHGPCGLKERFSEDLIQQVIGILDVNAFEARTTNGYSIRCLYPKLAVLSHSCVPNTTHSIHPSDGFRMTARTTVDVKEGEPVYLCYTHLLNGTSYRQSFLKDSKYFTCHCARCLDPTELGTHFSSFKCNKCDPGLILTTDPLDEEAKWKCTHCEFGTTGSAIARAVQVMQSEIDDLQNLDYDSERLQHLEKIQRKYRSVLHPNHYILTNARHTLIEMYGRVSGYELSELPDIVLEHKAEMCKSILKILEIIEPGKSRSRAMLLYELHAPLIMISRSAYAADILDKDVLKNKIQEVIDILQECSEILSWEDQSTPEGILAQVAQQSAAQLQESIKQLEME